MDSKTDMQQHSIECTLIRFEEKFAMLATHDGFEFPWPQNRLPQNLKKGDVVRLVLKTTRTEKMEEEKLAKEILNQILKKD